MITLAIRNRFRFGLAALALALALVGWQIVRPGETLYKGRKLQEWVDIQLFGDPGDPSAQFHAEEVLANLHGEDRQASFEAEEQVVVPYVIRRLKAKDNPLWKPYTAIKRVTPACIGNLMPAWREPKESRLAAAYWLGHRGPGTPETTVPVLCQVAGNDADKQVRRMAVFALSTISVYSPDEVPIMEKALLTDMDKETRLKAAEWFEQTTPDPDRIVPVLVRLLEDADSAVSEACMRALASYGHRAGCALEPLQKLTKVNDKRVAWVASRALRDIDPASATPVDIFRPRGQKPGKAFNEIGLLTEEGRLGEERALASKLAQRALNMGGDAIILRPPAFVGGQPVDTGNIWTGKVLYRASVLVYEPGSVPQRREQKR